MTFFEILMSLSVSLIQSPNNSSKSAINLVDKGLYTSTKGRIDPWLYGDIHNLHLRFQQLYLLCRQPRHIHDRRFIHTLCQHLSGNLKASQGHAFSSAFFSTFLHTFFYTFLHTNFLTLSYAFTLSGVYGILMSRYAILLASKLIYLSSTCFIIICIKNPCRKVTVLFSYLQEISGKSCWKS